MPATIEDCRAFAERIRHIEGVQLYRERYFSDPKHYAQDALAGRTHFADDSTLRYFHSRINHAEVECGGLLFGLIESSAMDPHNAKRGFRWAFFDIFGTCIERPDMENAYRTGEQARKAYREWLANHDAIVITTAAMLDRAKRQERAATEIRAALAPIEVIA